MTVPGKQRECLNCGMQHRLTPGSILDRCHEQFCSKCDASLWELSDGSTVTVDIAHNKETVAEALAKCNLALEDAWQGSYASELRIIVGGGLIRDAVLAELYFRHQSGVVRGYREENRGAILVTIRDLPGHGAF
ncbi:hypothetical protein [Pseudohongiella spirulinae]|uniref:Uncharacterized protein n=1 Tax=Pseudohongiella spirulinae TaxID=1249552 RepID=A0A0S2KBG3_9GAMM|nr:hypothetical protein [Pseudohongiella spirulinae]ALO45626.1 hypothetical protein PS2015_956 [Pseudohongiella spirulinae]